MALPNHSEMLLTRPAAAEALTAAGFPVSKATLATIASRRSDGPRFRRFGPRVLYEWSDLLDWAQSRLGPLIHSTSELNAVRQRTSASSQRPNEFGPARRMGK